MKTRVGIIFGGRSGEHEISIRSAVTVVEQIDKDRFVPIPIMITPEGQWLGPSDSVEFLPESARSVLSEVTSTAGPVVMTCNALNPDLSIADTGSGGLKQLSLDLAFPVLHGTYGEDGTVQGLLEIAGIPYVGCGVLASACGMDKAVMKVLFTEAGLPICDYLWFLRSEWESRPDDVLANIERKIGFPCFVKPANLGSSVGVSRAADSSSLKKAIELAAQYDRKILIEEALEMREIECAVIGNDSPRASQPGEYLIRDEAKSFLDYTEKYSGTGNNEFVVPAPVSNELAEKIRTFAVRAFKAIDCSGLARVDFFLRKDNGELIVNEINTMPGLTDASGFPKMWAGSGVEFRDVISELVDLALERANDRKRNQTGY
jgi:D-alanine-D-alanine ligase